MRILLIWSDLRLQELGDATRLTPRREDAKKAIGIVASLLLAASCFGQSATNGVRLTWEYPLALHGYQHQFKCYQKPVSLRLGFADI